MNSTENIDSDVRVLRVNASFKVSKVSSSHKPDNFVAKLKLHVLMEMIKRKMPFFKPEIFFASGICDTKGNKILLLKHKASSAYG